MLMLYQATFGKMKHATAAIAALECVLSPPVMLRVECLNKSKLPRNMRPVIDMRPLGNLRPTCLGIWDRLGNLRPSGNLREHLRWKGASLIGDRSFVQVDCGVQAHQPLVLLLRIGLTMDSTGKLTSCIGAWRLGALGGL